MIIFNEEEHSYHLDGVEFTSVTRLLKKVEKEKDWDAIAEKYAKKIGLTKEEVQEQWKNKNKESLSKGTAYHKIREDKFIEEGAYPILMEGSLKKAYDLDKLEAGIYPELIIYMPSHKICGTSDKVEIYSDKSFDILDFKTNAKLRTSGEMDAYWNPSTKKKEKEKLLPPVSHLYNCEIDKYSLQLSLYAFMLEEYGYTCNSLTLEHIIFNEDNTYKESKFIPVPYLKKEAKSILNYFKNKL